MSNFQKKKKKLHFTHKKPSPYAKVSSDNSPSASMERDTGHDTCYFSAKI